MASDKKVQQITAFNSGEYSDKLAGRVDIESFGKSARYMSNFMAEPTGGIKRFYGTNFIEEIEEPAQVRLVPFINNYGPMCLVIMLDKTGLIYGTKYLELDIKIPSVFDLSLLRWQQVNDRILFVHPSTQPFAIDFYGLDADMNPRFFQTSILFDDVPYFPIGYSDEYQGFLHADGTTDVIHLTVPDEDNTAELALPPMLIGTASYRRFFPGRYSFASGLQCYEVSDVCSLEPATAELVKVTNSVEEIMATGIVGEVTNYTGKSGGYSAPKTNPYWPVDLEPDDYNGTSDNPSSGGIRPMISMGALVGSDYVVRVFFEDITLENILNFVRANGFERSELKQDTLLLRGSRFTELQTDDILFIRIKMNKAKVNQYTVAMPSNADGAKAVVFRALLPKENMAGRRIKIHMNTNNTIVPWWQGRDVKIGDIAYSNGHYYQAEYAGKCGNLQPSHLIGIASDGGVDWRYLHSGSTSGTIVDVTDTVLTIRLNPGEYLPILDKNERDFNTYQWSIWGKDGVHPAQIYMQNNRLGLICNTKSYGAWNSLSCSDNYFDMSTEQHGQQLDTSAIVHLIPNNPDNKINWVLSFNQLYMGSYSGEFNIGAANKVFTPTTISVDRVSVLGGKDVMPLKYKELNLFVGATGQELYTIGYDYTRDDYVPKSLGYLTEHLLEQGITRMEAINNRDQNVYLLHDNGNMSILNYVSDQQILGYSRVDLGAYVRDFCYTYANDLRAAYVAVRRRDGYLSLEYVSLDEPTYMLSTELVDLDAPVELWACPRFAGKAVYIKREPEPVPEQQLGMIVIPQKQLNPIEEFVRVEWPEDGIMCFDKPIRRFTIGQEMVSELHTQPAFGRKMEGAQQQAIMMSLRLLESGAFEFGASNDFKTMFPYKNWKRDDEYGKWHKMYTGDATLNIPTGYAKNANEGTGPYANSTGIGINIRVTTPEPFNLLSITEVYQ